MFASVGMKVRVPVRSAICVLNAAAEIHRNGMSTMAAAAKSAAWVATTSPKVRLSVMTGESVRAAALGEDHEEREAEQGDHRHR